MESRFKTCNKCGVKKPYARFTKDRSKRDGLKTNCKECCRVSYKTWRDNNKKHLSDYMRNYRKRAGT